MRAASHQRWVLDAIPAERVPMGVRCPQCRYSLEERPMPTTCPECGQRWSRRDLVGTRAEPLSDWHKYVSWLAEYLPSARTWAIIVLCGGVLALLLFLGWYGLNQFQEYLGIRLLGGTWDLAPCNIM